MTTPDHPDWNLPQAIASSIANGTPNGSPGGVPLLHGSSTPSSTLLFNLTPSNQWQATSENVNIGYELYLDAICLLANTSAQMETVISFIDQATGLIVRTRRFTFWPAGLGAVGPQQVLARGPALGSKIVVDVSNQGASGAIQLNGALVQSGRIYTRDHLDPNNFVTSSSTRTSPPSDPAAKVLGANFVTALAAATTHTDQLPPYEGRAHVHWDSNSAAADCELVILANDDPAASLGTGIVFDEICASGGNGDAEIALPGVQCFLQIINHNAAAKNVRYTVTAIDY